MKLMKLAPAFLAIILSFGSCEQARLRIIHDREIRAELAKYSDILDTARSKIYLEGKRYYLVNSARPKISLSLYLKPDNNDRETIVAVRDNLIAFFGNNSWDARGKECYPDVITIEFLLEEGEETIIFYELFLGGILWGEKWHDDIFENILAGRTIEEIDALLGKYSDSLDIEQFRAFHAPYFIKVWLIVPGGYNRGTIITIGDDLVDFFENNRQELEEEYGRVGYIAIDFYRVEDGKLKEVYFINYNVRGPGMQWYRGWLDHISEL